MIHPDKKDITFKELNKDVIITATNLTDSYFFVASKQTTPEMSVIEAVVQSCCGNIALVPTTIKIRKQNKNAIIIDGGASILNFPIALFSNHTNPCYISNMLDNEFSRDLYSQYGGKWSNFKKKKKRNEKLSRQQAPRDQAREPECLHKHAHPQYHIIFMALFTYNLPEPPTSNRSGYQIYDKHRYAEDYPV